QEPVRRVRGHGRRRLRRLHRPEGAARRLHRRGPAQALDQRHRRDDGRPRSERRQQGLLRAPDRAPEQGLQVAVRHAPAAERRPQRPLRARRLEPEAEERRGPQEGARRQDHRLHGRSRHPLGRLRQGGQPSAAGWRRVAGELLRDEEQRRRRLVADPRAGKLSQGDAVRPDHVERAGRGPGSGRRWGSPARGGGPGRGRGRRRDGATADAPVAGHGAPQATRHDGAPADAARAVAGARAEGGRGSRPRNSAMRVRMLYAWNMRKVLAAVSSALAVAVVAIPAGVAQAQPDKARAAHDYKSQPLNLHREQLGTVAYAGNARARMRAGDCEGALASFDLALSTSNQDPTLYRDRGLCHEKLGHPFPAVDDYRVYLTDVPDAPDAPAIRERLARLEDETTGRAPAADK